MPRYSFLLTRFAGVAVRHGLRHGATPDSSCLMMDSVTISYAVDISVVLLYGVDLSSTKRAEMRIYMRELLERSGFTTRRDYAGKRGIMNNLEIGNALGF